MFHRGDKDSKSSCGRCKSYSLRRNNNKYMKIENQVCSLELAKKLKELKVKQKSLYWYVMAEDGERIESEPHYARLEEDISAFTVAELGEMLPITVKTTKYNLGYKWQSHYELIKNDLSGEMEYIKHFAAETEANARAKMLIYLLEDELT